MGIKTFLDNVRYLFRYNMKEIAQQASPENLNLILDSLKYELADDIKDLRIPKIKSVSETVDLILAGRSSISRFGDGEFAIINGENIPFQAYSERLANRLKKIFRSNDEFIFIGINYGYFHSVKNHLPFVKNFYRTYISKNRCRIEKLIDYNKQYYSAEFTQMFATLGEYDFESHYSKIKEIWQDRDIAVICGKSVYNSIEKNIFDCAKSIEYLYCASKNAFNDYDNLLVKAKNIKKDKLIVIILGPTATVLAYDLAKDGYQALDLGHIVKDYHYYTKSIEHNAESLSAFFKPD